MNPFVERLVSSFPLAGGLGVFCLGRKLNYLWPGIFLSVFLPNVWIYGRYVGRQRNKLKGRLNATQYLTKTALYLADAVQINSTLDSSCADYSPHSFTLVPRIARSLVDSSLRGARLACRYDVSGG